MTYPKCGNDLYIGSTLTEDSYHKEHISGKEVFVHDKCPPQLYTKICRRCGDEFYTHNILASTCSFSCVDRYSEE
jgi:hypothetical protein